MTDTNRENKPQPVTLPEDLVEQLANAYKHVRSDGLASLKFPDITRATIARNSLVELLGPDGIETVEARHVFTDKVEQQVLVPLEQLRRLDAIIDERRSKAPDNRVNSMSKLAGRLHVTGEFIDVAEGITFH